MFLDFRVKMDSSRQNLVEGDGARTRLTLFNQRAIEGSSQKKPLWYCGTDGTSSWIFPLGWGGRRGENPKGAERPLRVWGEKISGLATRGG